MKRYERRRGAIRLRVISSESEKSFSFAVKRCMCVNGNGKPDTP